jgi:hypothetical protein
VNVVFPVPPLGTVMPEIVTLEADVALPFASNVT